MSYIIKKNYVSLRTKKKCDERQNQRALSCSTSSFVCRNKKWANEWNFHASVILTNSKYCIRFCSFHFFFLLHRHVNGLDVNFCLMFFSFFMRMRWCRRLVPSSVPVDTCLNFEVQTRMLNILRVFVLRLKLIGVLITHYFMRWCSTEWALHIYCLQFPLFDRFGKWESVRVCVCLKNFKYFLGVTIVYPKRKEFDFRTTMINKKWKGTSKSPLIFNDSKDF